MKSIPLALKTHDAEQATTDCYLFRIRCKDGDVFGLTSLDVDVAYDDGRGLVTYRADNGFRPSTLESAADFSVDNAEAEAWTSELGITEQMIRAGKLDAARFDYYRVNYMDLAAGHDHLLRGRLGETVFHEMSFRLEMRSLSQILRQTISTLYSLTCRARFGSKPLGTVTDQPTERYPCMKDWEWGAGTVTAVDTTQPRRKFTSDVPGAEDLYVPGVIEVLDGPNAGAQMEVDVFDAGAIELALQLPYALTVGTTFRIRQDCDKTKAMCKDRHANLQWFRGEPFIPQDGGASMIPGAEIERA